MTCWRLRARRTSASTRWIRTLSSCPITSSRERHMAKAKAKKSKTKTKAKPKKAAPKKTAKAAAPKKPAKARPTKPVPAVEPQMDEGGDHHSPMGMSPIGMGPPEPDHW